MAAFHSMCYRLCKLPLKAQHFMNELQKIKQIADINGYHANEIDNIVAKHSKRIKENSKTTLILQQQQQKTSKRFSFEYIPEVTNLTEKLFKKYNIEMVHASGRKLKNLLGSTKDQIDKNLSSGIYKISCEDCEKIYIGQTKRNIKTRFKEHCSHIKYNRPQKSAVASHVLSNDHFNITDENNLTLIKQINKKSHLDAWESIEMMRNKNRLMNFEDAPIISNLFTLI